MHLYFLRHGKAEPYEEADSDAARRLTPEGIAEMRAEAAGLKRLDLRLEMILTSPLTRARETAEIVAEALALPAKSVVIAPRLAADAFSLDSLPKLLEGCDDDARIMLVGHEPTFSTVVGQLIGGASLDLKKGGLAYVETAYLRPGSGTLRWLLSPKHLLLHSPE